jgi:hypothetical protein
VQSVSAEANNTALLRFFGWQAAAGTARPLRLYSKLYLSLSFGFAPKAKHLCGRGSQGSQGLCERLLAAERHSRPTFASTCSCAPRVFRRASQGPQGRVVYPSGVRGEARIVGHVLQSAAPTGPSP